MPFTPAHVAAVLPLMHGRTARYLVPSALAIGAMAPDLPLFLPRWAPVSDAYAATHDPSGLPTWDLAVGGLAFVAWLVLRAPLLDLAPAYLRTRLRVTPAPSPSRWLWVAVSLVLGAATHILWDGFTHEGRFGVDLVPWLAQNTAGFANYKLAQYVSGVVGLAVVLLVLVRFVTRTRPDAPELGVLSAGSRRTARVVLVAVVAAFLLYFAIRVLSSSSLTLELAAYLMVTRSIGSVLAVVGLWGLVWHWLRRARVRGGADGSAS